MLTCGSSCMPRIDGGRGNRVCMGHGGSLGGCFRGSAWELSLGAQPGTEDWRLGR